jgi:phosphatidylserine decarboxylase
MFYKAHREGAKIILVSTIIVALLFILIDQFVLIEWLRIALMLVVLVFFILILQFFRNPKRQVPVNPNHILSSVDGKVVVIEEVEENEYFKDKRRMISVFMSPLNVHVTRYPMSGRVVYSKYHPGKYLVAWHPKASEENERTTVVIENEQFGKVLYRQIAGALAKRIVNYAKEGDMAVQGADAGFIKFGSRVDIYLPLSAKVKVTLGQKVKGAIDIIAEV